MSGITVWLIWQRYQALQNMFAARRTSRQLSRLGMDFHASVCERISREQRGRWRSLLEVG